MSISRYSSLATVALLVGCAAAAAPPAAPAAGVAGPAVLDAYDLPELPAARPVAADEYADRRRALAARMGDGVFIAVGAPAPDQDYLPFSQTPALMYLTGIHEPGAVLLIAREEGAVSERLFVLPRDPAREVWEGPRLGVEGARERTGIPAAPVAELEPALDALLPGAGRIYTATPPADATGLLEQTGYAQRVVAAIANRYSVPVAPMVDELRALRGVKSATELDLIRRAVAITTLAHRAAMRTVEPGMNEFEIQALIEYVFRRHGADRPAFASIVGSGPNATTLHYNANDRFMRAEDMLVMDIGASYRGYAADITRSVPVDGTFSSEQRAIYEIVLAAQKAAEAVARPDASWQDLAMAAQRELALGLARLGLIEAPGATYECAPGRQCPQLRLFYMHGLGHGIGLEVHDPDAADTGVFRVGSAFTIEPGLYVREDALDHIPDTPANDRLRAAIGAEVQRYRNIGVRIEDDYLITPTGVDRISEGAPREIGEIERLMAPPGVGEAGRRAAVVEWYRQTEPGVVR